MTLSFEEFRVAWSALHGGASTTGIVGGWLRISFWAGKFLSVLRISPNLLTLLGVVAAALTAFISPHWSGALFLAFSLFFDGIDGSVAIIQNRVSAIGATWDGIADRISEVLWAIAFYRLGAPITWVLALASLAFFQEYARAKLVALGVKEVGVVTPGERPVRASFLLCAFIAPNALITPIALGLVLLQALSFLLVTRFSFSKLR